MTRAAARGSGRIRVTTESPAPRRRAGIILVRRLVAHARLPERAYPDDAAFDLFAAEACTIPPLERRVVGCGIALQMPAGIAALTVPRSGLAARQGLSLVNAPGLIDPGYRGEIRLVLLNTDTSTPIEVAVGDRVAQLLPTVLPVVQLAEVHDLSDTDRAERGFGSSGV